MEGDRRVWGTLKEATMRPVKAVLSKVFTHEDYDGVTVHRKYKHGRKARWWFILHGSESTLTNIEKRWNIMEIQTGWKIEHCYQPSDVSNTNLDEPSVSSNETNEPAPQNQVAIPSSNENANQEQPKESDEAAQSETPSPS